MRRFGSPPRPHIRYTDRPGVYGVIWRGGQILVTEETAQQVEVQLPGGGIDPGEGPTDALHREGLEETGWRLRILTRLGVYQRYTYMPDYDLWARKICHIYLCAPGLHLGAPREMNHRAFWMEPDAAVEVLASSGDAWFVQNLGKILAAGR